MKFAKLPCVKQEDEHVDDKPHQRISVPILPSEEPPSSWHTTNRLAEKPTGQTIDLCLSLSFCNGLSRCQSNFDSKPDDGDEEEEEQEEEEE